MSETSTNSSVYKQTANQQGELSSRKSDKKTLIYSKFIYNGYNQSDDPKTISSSESDEHKYDNEFTKKVFDNKVSAPTLSPELNGLLAVAGVAVNGNGNSINNDNNNNNNLQSANDSIALAAIHNNNDNNNNILNNSSIPLAAAAASIHNNNNNNNNNNDNNGNVQLKINNITVNVIIQAESTFEITINDINIKISRN